MNKKCRVLLTVIDSCEWSSTTTTHIHTKKENGGRALIGAQIPLHIWPFFGWRFHFRNLWSLKLNHDIRASFPLYTIGQMWSKSRRKVCVCVCQFYCLVLTSGGLLLTSKFSRNEINDCWFLNRIFDTPYGLFGLATVVGVLKWLDMI